MSKKIEFALFECKSQLCICGFFLIVLFFQNVLFISNMTVNIVLVLTYVIAQVLPINRDKFSYVIPLTLFFPLCLVVQNIWLQILCALFLGVCQEQQKIRFDGPQKVLPSNYISVYILGLITMFALQNVPSALSEEINIFVVYTALFSILFIKRISHHLLFPVFFGLYVIWGLFFFQNGYCYWSSYPYF